MFLDDDNFTCRLQQEGPLGVISCNEGTVSKKQVRILGPILQDDQRQGE